MKLLVLSVAAALFLIVITPSSAPVYAQSNSVGGKTSQSDSGGRAARTGSTSKKQ
jgi:hypothetical protein